ncbi:hypothetical protein M404DRAFT_1003385 [Pisolithus tinctorius Marx 270]|uniref:Uncharacterized protein n=1 Tax=Pisolithus tinctorius Marx 270 TaxID=870435 RepID=A0A0C3P172_PISTI|nr:hypothetical protein M404DRAFT_1003385 [Pisolithus tinctorius Marx 270]
MPETSRHPSTPFNSRSSITTMHSHSAEKLIYFGNDLDDHGHLCFSLPIDTLLF